jgi:hypothetical protein
MLNVVVTFNEVASFLNYVLDNDLPDEYTINVEEGKLKFDKKNMRMYIVERYVTKTPDFSDLQMIVAMKVAKRAGFKVYLEPKFSN